MLWPLVPLSRWLILDLTLLHFSFQFRESKGLIQFLWCRGGNSWGCLLTWCRRGIRLLCVSWAHLGGDSWGNAVRIITQRALSFVWQPTPTWQPPEQSTLGATQTLKTVTRQLRGKTTSMDVSMASIKNHPTGTGTEETGRDLKGQERNCPAGRWGCSPKTAVALDRSSSAAAAGHEHLSQSKLWFRGRKTGSVTLPLSPLALCPLQAASPSSQDISRHFWTNF